MKTVYRMLFDLPLELSLSCSLSLPLSLAFFPCLCLATQTISDVSPLLRMKRTISELVSGVERCVSEVEHGQHTVLTAGATELLNPNLVLAQPSVQCA